MKKKIINIALFLFASQINTNTFDLKLNFIKQSFKSISFNKTALIGLNKIILLCILSVLMPKLSFLFMICSVFYCYYYKIKIDFQYTVIACLLSLLLKYFNFRLHILILLIYLIYNMLYLAIDAFRFKAQKILITINIICILKIAMLFLTYPFVFANCIKKFNHKSIVINKNIGCEKEEIVYFVINGHDTDDKNFFNIFTPAVCVVNFYPKNIEFNKCVKDAYCAYEETKLNFKDKEIAIYGRGFCGAIAIELVKIIEDKKNKVQTLIVDRSYKDLFSAIENESYLPTFASKIFIYCFLENIDFQKSLNSLNSKILLIRFSADRKMQESNLSLSKSKKRKIIDMKSVDSELIKITPFQIVFTDSEPIAHCF